MDTGNAFIIVTQTARQTRRLGRQVGERLKSGLVIRLTGDLGSGKTCFVQGLAQGLEVPAGYDITSPTYALIHEYPGRMPLVHADLYRISDETEVDSIGLEDHFGPNTVVAVEWADRLSDEFWPAPMITFDFQTGADEVRRIQLIGYGLQNVNLIKDVLALWGGMQE